MIYKLVLVFAISLIGQASAQDRDEVQWELFEKESALYFDVGSGSQMILSAMERQELEGLLAARIQNLEESLAAPSLFESAVSQKDLELARRQKVEAWFLGVGGALAGGIGSVITLDWLMMSMMAPSRSDWTTTLAVGLVGAAFAKIGASLGIALAQARHQSVGSQRDYEWFDERSRQILKVAQDVSARMRAMAVPMNFWSARRFGDFVSTYIAFFALERLLINDQHALTAQMNEALEQANAAKVLKASDEQTDFVDVRLTQKRLAGVRRLRRLELTTLRWVRLSLHELDQGADVSRVSPAKCMEILRSYIQ